MTSGTSAETNKPLKLVILGGGTAGWMAANLFVKKWQIEQVEVTLIESPDIGIIGVGEGSTPSLKRFFEMVDISEHEWMPICNATYKVNIKFNGWSPASGIESYSHPFTTQVDLHTSHAFYQNCHTRRYGMDTHVQPDDFYLNSVLAKQGKAPISSDNFPFTIEYGYHFDSGLLGKFLGEKAVERGVIHRQEKVVSISRDDSGNIATLMTEKGEEIGGDFFIDSTGFSAMLMQKTLGVRFNSYKENLFNDSAVVMPTPINDVIPVETESTALSAGWCWKIPLTNRFGNGYVYSADHLDKDKAETEFRQHLGTFNSEQDCHHLSMKVGQLETHWSHNCIGIGLSQGFIEPLEATALHLVQISIEMFIAKFEQGGFSNQYQKEYNSAMSHRFERVRDYIVAHYKLNTRDDTDYWRANRNNKHISNSLAHVLDVWYKRGDLRAEIERQNLSSHFDTASWHCLLAGYGAFPELADKQPSQGDLYYDKKIQRFLDGCSLNFKSHRDKLINQSN